FMTGRWGEPGTYILTSRFEELWRRGEPVRRPRSVHGFPDSLVIDYGDGLLVEARLRPGARDADLLEFTRVVIEAAWAARTGEWERSPPPPRPHKVVGVYRSSAARASGLLSLTGSNQTKRKGGIRVIGPPSRGRGGYGGRYGLGLAVRVVHDELYRVGLAGDELGLAVGEVGSG
ncbi:MAG: hypothetical protein ACP5ME_15495, partial [Anaerolineae bacterium]